MECSIGKVKKPNFSMTNSGMFYMPCSSYIVNNSQPDMQEWFEIKASIDLHGEVSTMIAVAMNFISSLFVIKNLTDTVLWIFYHIRSSNFQQNLH
jgi:hypothetical protein